jgi:hypothetical protein
MNYEDFVEMNQNLEFWLHVVRFPCAVTREDSQFFLTHNVRFVLQCV